MNTQDFSTLSVSVDEQIASICFSRPELLNRFDAIQHAEFPKALRLVKDNPDVRVLILHSQGKAFSAGGDFDMIAAANQSYDLRNTLTTEAQDIFELMTSMPMPVIAAVQGAAVGLGATVVSLCDIVVAYENAKISDPHVQVGLVAGDGGIISWGQSVGVTRAKRYLLTGDPIPAREAHAFGLITDLVENPEDVLGKANEIATQICRLPSCGVRGTKMAFNRLTTQITGAVFDLGLSYEMNAMASQEVTDVIAQVTKNS